MSADPARLQIAIADPTVFGQNMISDLLADEGARNITKFYEPRELLIAIRDMQFDLILVDDEFQRFSVTELMAMAQRQSDHKTQFIALQSSLSRESVDFLRGVGIGGVLLKPVAPKRFSHLFRSLFRSNRSVSLAA